MKEAASKEEASKKKPDSETKAAEVLQADEKMKAKPAEAEKPEAITEEQKEPDTKADISNKKPTSEKSDAVMVNEPDKVAETAEVSDPAIAAPKLSEGIETGEKDASSNKAPENSEDAATGPSQILEVPMLGGISAAPSVADFDSDDESDIVSIVSDISDGVIEDAIALAKQDAETAVPAPLPPNPDEEDEFEKDPWNAIAVVGLRIYSKDSGVSVKVIRPRDWEGEEGKGETKLDVDDSAADATKDIELESEGKEESKKEGESEGSGVIV